MNDAVPIAANRTLRRLPNAAYRVREYLTEAEVERLIEAARRRGRNGPRDGAAILLAYRHGLRAAELCQLRWSQIDLRRAACTSIERRAVAPAFTLCTAPSSERCGHCKGRDLTSLSLRRARQRPRMVQRTGRAAKLPFPVHPHMLRHSTGYKLANDGADTRSLAHYLGHRNLQSTARYTALAPDRFKGFWRD